MGTPPRGHMRIGVVTPRDLPDDELITFAQTVERLGFDHLWMVEDLGYKGGFTQAAAVLATTDHVRVGIGILPVAVRNPVFTAMEAATLARTFPGRLTLGLGHGMPQWMRQIGEGVSSPLTLLAETLVAVRGLLAGDTLTMNGRYVRLDGVRLEVAPEIAPPVIAGVRGPRSLMVSGEHADGTLLSEPVTVPYLTAARELTRQGAARRGSEQGSRHDLYAYNVAYVHDDPGTARDQVREAVAVFGQPDWWPHIEPLPFAADFRALANTATQANELARALPGDWIDQLAVVGTPDMVRGRLGDLAAAGAAESSFFVSAKVTASQLRRLAQAVLA